MKATRDMEDAFFKKLPPAGQPNVGDIQDALQAVLDLIDPVPANVRMITDMDRDRWLRIGPTTWRLRNSDHIESIIDIVAQFGPITWDGKEEAAK